MSMARPARASSAVAVMLLLRLPLLLIFLLSAPASSQAGAALGKIISSPAVRQVGSALIREAAKTGGEALIKQKFATASASSNGKNLLGSAAADNASLIVFNVSIGSPQQTFYGVLDISNAFLWVQCPQPPAFYQVPCDNQMCLSALDSTTPSCAAGVGECRYDYGDTTGYLAYETFAAIGGQTIAGNVVFGCSRDSAVAGNTLGAIGFNQESLSILSQLRISRFSYFLTPDDDSTAYATSVVLLGAQAVPQTTRSRSTPLLIGSNAFPGLYYVQLTGIQVDAVPLAGIPTGAFDLAPDGSSGGVVLSTTTPLTFLQKKAYDALRQALVNKIKSNPVTSDQGFDLCYHTQSVAELTFPKLTLVFAGPDSPSMELTTVHYFYKDMATGLQCLTILPTPDDTPFGSILGSMLQAGTNMIYDAGAGQLTFENFVAAATVPSQVSLMVIASLLVVWVLVLF